MTYNDESAMLPANHLMTLSRRFLATGCIELDIDHRKQSNAIFDQLLLLVIPTTAVICSKISHG